MKPKPSLLSDEGRDAISADLKFFKHPLDCRRKEKGQEKREKWFTGERFVSLCDGSRGSPGDPKAFARILLTLADELLVGLSQIHVHFYPIHVCPIHVGGTQFTS